MEHVTLNGATPETVYKDIKMDDMTAPQKDAKVSRLPPGWLQCIGRESGLLRVSGRDMDQTKKLKYSL